MHLCIAEPSVLIIEVRIIEVARTAHHIQNIRPHLQLTHQLTLLSESLAVLPM